MVLASVEKESGCKLPKITKNEETYEIEGLELDEVSAVDQGANPFAVMALWKRAPKQGDTSMNIEELTKRLETTEASVEALTKKADDAQKELDAAQAKASAISKALEAAGVTLTEDNGTFVAEVAKAENKDEEFVMIDGEKVAKSAVPAPILKQLETQKAQIDALVEKDAKAELAKRAEEMFPNLGGTASEKGTLVKMLDGLTGDEKAAMEKSLKAADAAVAKMFDEVGGNTNEPSSTQTELDGMVAKYASEKGVTTQVAFTEVTKAGKGRELLLKTRAEAN